MRALAAVAMLAASAASLAAAAPAKTVSTKVVVVLSVAAKSATVAGPASVRLDAAGRPIVSAGSFLPGWPPGDIPAVTFAIAPDRAGKGTDVATINF